MIKGAKEARRKELRWKIAGAIIIALFSLVVPMAGLGVPFVIGMSMSDSAETNLLLLLFNNTNWANIGDATGVRGSTTAGSFYIALHTADPGEAGNQGTSEATYTSYARVAVARSSGGFTVSGNTVSNAAAINFPACTGGSNTITHFSIGRASSGTGEIVASGALTASLAVSNGITPSFAIGQLTVVAD